MIPSISKATHYEYWANHFVGEAIMKRCDASIHVEDFDDAVFWEKVMVQYAPDNSFNFIYYSQTPKGNDATGVIHCLEYKPYLSKKFFICIDSDYRYLLKEEGLTVEQFILQTYTYSIENHFCQKSNLNSINQECTSLVNDIFDFESFLDSYSQTIYELLIWHLQLLSIHSDAFSKQDFSRIINLLQVIPDYDVLNNGKAVIAELANRTKEKLESLKLKFPDLDITHIQNEFIELGVNKDTAYLFVRGHNLFDLIVAIGDRVNENLLKTRKVQLGSDSSQIKALYKQLIPYKRAIEKYIMFDQYREIKMIKEDIAKILS